MSEKLREFVPKEGWNSPDFEALDIGAGNLRFCNFCSNLDSKEFLKII